MPFTHGLFSPPFNYTAQINFAATSSGGAQSTVRYWHPVSILKDVSGYFSGVDNTDTDYKWAEFDSSNNGNTFEFSIIQNFDFSYKETASPFTLTLGRIIGGIYQAEYEIFDVWTDSAQSPSATQVTLDATLPTPITGLLLSVQVPADEAYTQTQSLIIGVKQV